MKQNASTPDVSAELNMVLNAKKPDGTPKYSFEDFNATFPPMMLALLGQVPFEEMVPEAQELVVLSMGQVGLELESTPEQIEQTITAYVAKHPPNQELLGAIKGVLTTAFAKAENAVTDAGRKLTGEKIAAPMLHEKKPEGSVDVRKLAPKIRM
jgi:hypothetical protein